MKLTYSSGKKNKIHISTDGEYRFTVDADFWFSLGIYQNTEVSESELAEIEQKIMVRRAYNKGIDFLSRRAHSKNELIQKISKTSDKKYAIIAVDLLEQKGYVNDSDFAEQYYEYLKRTKHFGKKRIEMELAKKGIDRAVIYSVAEADGGDSLEQIRQLLQTRFANKLYDEKAKRRTFNALVRLGYSYSDIKSAMSVIEYFEEN